MIPVSVAVVTKDEEKNIIDALESVKDFEDIVVVDAFSEDNTADICRRYTDRVIQSEWQGYAKQKQMAVDLAEKQWVLILDADERVTPELKKEILEKITLTSNLQTPNFQNPPLPPFNPSMSPLGKGGIERGVGGFAGFYIPRKNFFLGRWIRHSGWWPDYTVRLFRKDCSHIEQREIHEKVIVRGSVGYIKEPLEHYTYRTVSAYIKKMENYSTLSAKEMLAKKPQPSAASLILRMLISPVFTFMKMFFLRQGFRDGLYGFILAVLYSFYTFLKYVKVWEKKAG